MEDGDLAQFWPDDHEIYVSPGPSAAANADRLLHEVIHAIESVVLSKDDRLEERQVTTLSTIIVDTLIRNAEFKDHFFHLINECSGG